MADSAQDQSPQRLIKNGEVVPRPDPTSLTTQQLMAAIAAQRELFEAKLSKVESAIKETESHRANIVALIESTTAHLRELFSVQLSDRDARANQMQTDNKEAISTAMTAAKEVSVSINEKTAHLQQLHDERFKSIALQFQERDVRNEQSLTDLKNAFNAGLASRDVAVAAALTAQKEAVSEQNKSSSLAISKSESATMKSLDQIAVLLTSATAALDSKIIDIKDRITIIESLKAGQVEQRSTSQSSQVQWVGILGFVLGGIVGLAGLIIALTKEAPPPPRVIVQPPVVAVPTPSPGNNYTPPGERF